MNEPTYYDQPLLQAPVWKPYIPLYYFVGGAAGATLALGAAAQLDGARSLRTFVNRTREIAIGGCTISAALLIADLGRPERFVYMLRVFRPTSPMNMGVWILTGAPAAAAIARLFGRGWIGQIAGLLSGLFGLGLATYTGVLIGTTAIPLWQDARRLLPVLFGASSVAAAASIADLTSGDERVARMTRVFGIAGRAAELAATVAIEKRANRVASVARPLHAGASGLMWKSAAVLTGAGLLTLLLPKQTPAKRKIAGALGIAGSLLLRFAVHEAGTASAGNARASFELQQGASQKRLEPEKP